MSLKTVSIVVLVHSLVLFLVGVPPFDHIAYHYFTKYHPIARQLKVVREINAMSVAPALVTAIEIGLLDALKNEALSVEELSSKLNVPLRSLEALCDKLVSSDYLEVSRDGKFSNAATSQHHLVSNIPHDQDMKPLLMLMGDSRNIGTNMMLESVRNGGSVMAHHAEVDSNPWWELFAKVTGPMMKGSAKDLTTTSVYKKNGEIKVLDIASGSGQWAFAVAQAFPNSNVFLQDYDNVLMVTKQNAVDENVNTDQLTFVPGNFFTVDLPEDHFDVAQAPNIIHHFSEETTIEFLQKVLALLKPGGKLVIAELCRPESPYSLTEGFAPMTRGFSLSMLTWSQHGKAYSANELIQISTKAGFEDMKWESNSFPFTCFITGRKPRITIVTNTHD